MAGLGDIARAFGYSVTSGLGTAEEQRTRADKLRAAEEERKHRADLLAETRRGHELQYGTVDITDLVNPLRKEVGLDPIPGRITAPRGLADKVFEGYTKRDPGKTVDFGQLYQDYRGMLEEPEITRPVQAQTPGEAGPPELSDVTPESFPGVIRDQAAEGARAGRLSKVPTSIADNLVKAMPSFKDLKEQRAGKAKEEGIKGARERLVKGETWEKIAPEYPSLTAKDVYGYEPAAPSKPEKTPAQIEAEEAARTRGKESGKSPEAVAAEKRKRDLDEQFTQARIDATKTLNAARAGGKPDTLSDLSMHIDRLKRIDEYLQGVDSDIMPDEEKTTKRQELAVLISDALGMVKELQRKKGGSKAPRAATYAEMERAKKQPNRAAAEKYLRDLGIDPALPVTQ